MVVAGVYLVARMFPMYLFTPEVLELITITGAVTALYAAVVACAQTDIKRVLAFSTISQIAFMFTALGVARPELHEGVGYMASMFHLFTHAMFKGLLFLCAGAIIHMVHSNEMDAMGNLKKYMPITHITFLIACLAIAGIPPFAGFFSKDEILVACYLQSPLWGVWMSAVAGLTAFYMFRLYYRIFWWNKPDYSHHTPHDCEWVMTLPLVLLAVVSCVAGFIPFSNFVTFDGHAHHTEMNWTVAGASIAIAVVGIVIATVLYRKENPVPDRIADAVKGLHKAAYRRFYMDEVYQFVTHKIIFGIICKSIAWFDHVCVDGFMNLLARMANSAAYSIRKLQSGSIQMYVWIYLIGALVLATATFLVLI
ncbi:MAG: proton-conducting transporter membrane subunit, partial [Bacteroidales bacterium]|nr:proton-conducting transporter membrane subunit [Bacteroidales bacterium]